MNRKDRAVVEGAIRELMKDDGDFTGAIQSLCQLVGWDYPAARLTKNLEPVELRVLATAPPREFSVSDVVRVSGIQHFDCNGEFEVVRVDQC